MKAFVSDVWLIRMCLGTCIILSCQKKIDVNPREGEALIVIQGYLYEDSVVNVTVTKTVGYLSHTKPSGISAATVTLSDHTGSSEVLVWNAVKQRIKV